MLQVYLDLRAHLLNLVAYREDNKCFSSPRHLIEVDSQLGPSQAGRYFVYFDPFYVFYFFSMCCFHSILFYFYSYSLAFVCVVDGIGKLFHFYSTTLAPRTKQKAYLQICQQSRNKKITNPTVVKLIDAVGRKFFFFALCCMFPLSDRVKKEEGFALAVFLKSRGLSDDGIDQLAFNGIGQGSRQYRETRAERLEEQRQYTRYDSPPCH